MTGEDLANGLHTKDIFKQGKLKVSKVTVVESQKEQSFPTVFLPLHFLARKEKYRETKMKKM